MKAIFEIDLNGEPMVNELERTFLEISAYTDNIAFLLGNSMTADVVESVSLKAYQRKQVEAKVLYENQKRELERTYIPDYLYGTHQYDWKLNFGTGIVTVTVYDEPGIRLLQEHGVAFTSAA